VTFNDLRKSKLVLLNFKEITFLFLKAAQYYKLKKNTKYIEYIINKCCRPILEKREEQKFLIGRDSDVCE
jgi:hypothetical protein